MSEARDVFITGATGHMGRAFAARLLEQIVTALAWAVEHPSSGERLLQVPGIRKIRP